MNSYLPVVLICQVENIFHLDNHCQPLKAEPVFVRRRNSRDAKEIKYNHRFAEKEAIFTCSVPLRSRKNPRTLISVSNYDFPRFECFFFATFHTSGRCARRHRHTCSHAYSTHVSAEEGGGAELPLYGIV
jgi:hypothetical protein